MNTHIEKEYAIKEKKIEGAKALFILREGFEVNGRRVVEGESFEACYKSFNEGLEYVKDGIHYKPWLKSQFKHVYSELPLSWLRCIYYTHKPLKRYALFTMDGRVYFIKSGRQFERIFKGRFQEFLVRNSKSQKAGEYLEMTSHFKHQISPHLAPFVKLVVPTKGGYKAYLIEGYLSLQKSDDLDKCECFIVGKDLSDLKKNFLRFAPLPFQEIEGHREVISDLTEYEQERLNDVWVKTYHGNFERCKKVVWTRFGVYMELKEPSASYARTQNPFKGERKAHVARSYALKFLGRQWQTQASEETIKLFNSDILRGFLGVQEKYVKRIGQYFNLATEGDENNALYFVELKEGYVSTYCDKPLSCRFFLDLEDVQGFCAKQYIVKKRS